MFTLQTESTQAMMDRFADAEQRARDREERIAVERERLWADRERLLSEQADREAKNYAARIEAHAYGQLVEGGLKYGGAIASAVMEQKFGGGMSAQVQKIADAAEPSQFYMFMSLMNPELKEAMRPLAEKIVMAWPEDKRHAFAKAHADYTAGQLAQTPTQAQPTQTAAPESESASVAADPEWRTLGYESEQERLDSAECTCHRGGCQVHDGGTDEEGKDLAPTGAEPDEPVRGSLDPDPPVDQPASADPAPTSAPSPSPTKSSQRAKSAGKSKSKRKS
jgi:hypothetical protein